MGGHRPWAMPTASLANIFTGAPINAMPFQFSGACFLLSVSTWMQVATFCNHLVSMILCAIKIAIHKCCSRAAWCVDASIQWAVVQAHHMPTTPVDTGYFLRGCSVTPVYCPVIISHTRTGCSISLRFFISSILVSHFRVDLHGRPSGRGSRIPLHPLVTVFKGGVPCAARALCARCAKSRPFSTTGRQFFGCRIAAGYYCRCVSL